LWLIIRWRFADLVDDFLTGVRYFWQGLGMLLRRPKLLLTGMLPALLTTALLLGGTIALIVNIGDVTALVTPFADHWAAGWRLAIRIAAGIVLIGGTALLGLVAFTALTLIIGGPFYEHIAEQIEDDLGVTEGRVDLSWRKLLVLGVRDGIVLLLRSLLFTIALFIAGFLPVVGQSVVPVLIVLVTAWFIGLEVVGVAFYRRGIGLRGRTEMLRRRRMLVVGLGLPAALLAAIPLMSIVVMPVAFAGGVLAALDTLGLMGPEDQYRPADPLYGLWSSLCSRSWPCGRLANLAWAYPVIARTISSSHSRSTSNLTL
jgi:CysZ protein